MVFHILLGGDEGIFMRIRCQHCRKRISIDAAFAGGFCRCPYCNEIVPVPARQKSATVEARSDRPESPEEIPTGHFATARAESTETLPTADPVRIQGIVTIVLAGFLILMIAFGIALIMKSRTSPDRAKPDGESLDSRRVLYPSGNGQNTTPPMPTTNPLTIKGIAGMKFATPVVFILDGTSAMKQSFDYGVALVRYSIRAMDTTDKFNLIVVGEEGLPSPSEDWLTGGQAGDEQVKNFLSVYVPAGAAELYPAVVRAISLRPRSIVIITRRALENPESIIEKASKASIRIYSIGLEYLQNGALQVMKTLANKTGGGFRHLPASEIMDWIDQVEPLP